LVAFAARDAPLLRNQLGADALVDDAVALEKLRRVRRAVVLGDLAGRRERDVAHVLHAATDGDVVYAGRDQRGREVHRLLRRGALAVDGRGRRLDREPSLQPGVAADVVRLLAVLLHAAGEHILDRLCRDPRPLDHLDPRPAEELVRVDVLVVTLLGVSATDRGADCFDDHDLAAFHGPPRSRW